MAVPEALLEELPVMPYRALKAALMVRGLGGLLREVALGSQSSSHCPKYQQARC